MSTEGGRIDARRGSKRLDGVQRLVRRDQGQPTIKNSARTAMRYHEYQRARTTTGMEEMGEDARGQVRGSGHRRQTKATRRLPRHSKQTSKHL